MYTIEFLIKNNFNNYKYLDKVYYIKFTVQNKIINHCKKLLSELNNNKEYKDLLNKRLEYKAKGNKKSISEINKKLKQIRLNLGLSAYDLHTWSKPIKHKYKKYLSSQMIDDICDDVYQGVEDVLFNNGKYLHNKKLDDIYSISAKSITNGFTFRTIKEKGKVVGYDYFTINCPNTNVKLKFILDLKDQYEVDGFRPKDVKYIKIVRRQFNNGYHYYIQFLTDGIPPLKLNKGKGNAGIDPGVSSVAAVTDSNCLLEDLSPNIDKYNKQIIKKQRELERKNRQNNPDCFKSDGTIKKNSKLKLSKNAKRTKRELRTLHRKKAEHTKQNQCRIANNIIPNCDNVYCEKINFKALQKRSSKTERSDKESTIKTKSGIKTIKKYKKKKRFGKSLQNRAPSQFIKILEYKCTYYDIPFNYIETDKFKASQYNHQKDKYIKKELGDRWNELTYKRKKVKIQRDLYSAFLIKNSDSTLAKPDRKKCKSTFNEFVENHNKCIDYVKENNKNRLSSFGF